MFCIKNVTQTRVFIADISNKMILFKLILAGYANMKALGLAKNIKNLSKNQA